MLEIRSYSSRSEPRLGVTEPTSSLIGVVGFVCISTSGVPSFSVFMFGWAVGLKVERVMPRVDGTDGAHGAR